jgi:RNA polymerase sigma-70 factor (ECF subfamily)
MQSKPPDEAQASRPHQDPTPGLGPADLEEHAWVRAAQQGDEAAFERLVHAHQGRAWRVARNLVPGDEDARDLVQEAFLRVFRHLPRFDFQHPFSTWLYRIVTNLAIDHLRKRRPALSTSQGDEERPALDLPDDEAPPPGRALESAETAAEVRACLETLAPHFQSALVLRELEGLPCTEIAEIVGATHVTVRWRLHRGRKLFQEEWERRERLRAAGGDAVQSLAPDRASARAGRKQDRLAVDPDQEGR